MNVESASFGFDRNTNLFNVTADQAGALQAATSSYEKGGIARALGIDTTQSAAAINEAISKKLGTAEGSEALREYIKSRGVMHTFDPATGQMIVSDKNAKKQVDDKINLEDMTRQIGVMEGWDLKDPKKLAEARARAEKHMDDLKKVGDPDATNADGSFVHDEAKRKKLIEERARIQKDVGSKSQDSIVNQLVGKHGLIGRYLHTSDNTTKTPWAGNKEFSEMLEKMAKDDPTTTKAIINQARSEIDKARDNHELSGKTADARLRSLDKLEQKLQLSGGDSQHVQVMNVRTMNVGKGGKK
jgi:hypothetical protein